MTDSLVQDIFLPNPVIVGDFPKNAAGISYGYGERRNVFCNDTACSDNAPLADCNTRKNYDIRTYPDILFYADWL